MALATNSTPGSIVLGGDLTGVANAPELRVSGVVPGSYGPATIVADSKGRIVFAQTTTWPDIEPVVDDASYTGKGIMMPCDEQLSVEDGVFRVSTDASALYDRKGFVQISSSNFQCVNGVLSVLVATPSVPGVFKVGDALSVTNGVMSTSLPTATDAIPGVVKIGTGFSYVNGVLGIPVASGTVLGTIVVGSRLTVNAGEVNVPVATTSVPGVITVGSGLTLNTDEVSVLTATDTIPGAVTVGSRLTINAGEVNIPLATTEVPGVITVGTGISETDGELGITGVLHTNYTTTLDHTQYVATDALSGTSVNWDGSAGNIFTYTTTDDWTLNNGTNITAGTWYHFIITNSVVSKITYGSQFTFRTDTNTQPIGSGSINVLSCYALTTSKLLCIMQPDFI